MKKIIFILSLCVAMKSGASTIFVERPVQKYDLVPGVEQIIPIDQQIELHIADITDYANADVEGASLFQIRVFRVSDPPKLLCSNQLKVPFGSEITLVLSEYGITIRLVATDAGDAANFAYSTVQVADVRMDQLPVSQEQGAVTN